jgi:sugar lactone lactonase YvrE
MRLVCGVLLTLFASACSDAGEADKHPPGAWGSGEQWRLVEEARIGARDEGGPEMFANIVDATIDPMGRIWVADAQQHQIRLFEATGRHVRTIGRGGGGPGEFRGIAGMTWAADSRLWVVDNGNARFVVYDTAGTLVATHSRTSAMMASPWPGRFDSLGRLYDVTGTLADDGSILTWIVRTDTGGQPRDTFRLPPFKAEQFQITSGDERNRRVTAVNVPFTGRQVWALDPEGGVWVANTAQYRIERHTFSGGGRRTVVEREVGPVPVSREDRDRILESFSNFTRQGGRIDASRIPRVHPPLAGFLFDDAGRMWVMPMTGRGEPRVLDVFEADGRYLGRVALPGPYRSTPKAIRGNRMAVVVRDEDDVPSLTVMRIEKPAR